LAQDPGVFGGDEFGTRQSFSQARASIGEVSDWGGSEHKHDKQTSI
jgi:hypothetical protein